MIENRRRPLPLLFGLLLLSIVFSACAADVSGPSTPSKPSIYKQIAGKWNLRKINGESPSGPIWATITTTNLTMHADTSFAVYKHPSFSPEGQFDLELVDDRDKLSAKPFMPHSVSTYRLSGDSLILISDGDTLTFVKQIVLGDDVHVWIGWQYQPFAIDYITQVSGGAAPNWMPADVELNMGATLFCPFSSIFSGSTVDYKTAIRTSWYHTWHDWLGMESGEANGYVNSMQFVSDLGSVYSNGQFTGTVVYWIGFGGTGSYPEISYVYDGTNLTMTWSNPGQIFDGYVFQCHVLPSLPSDWSQ